MLNADHPEIQSWVNVPNGSPFPIQNLPFGIFSNKGTSARPGVAIGDEILDLKAVNALGIALGPFKASDFSSPVLNDLMSHGKKAMTALRERIGELLKAGNSELKAHEKEVLVKQSEAQMHLPVRIGDYTDFYSSIDHATNVGKMFRDPTNALLPNWRHIPVGYHGRSSSIIPSGVPIHRPKGQTKPDADKPPVYGPCRLLDFELEMGFVTFDGKPLGQSITTAEAEDYIFGMVLFNDWSARDIQKWEYVPLGPFLAKNFASSMSPWIVTLEALEPFKVAGEKQQPAVLPYLEYTGKHNVDIPLEVIIENENGASKVVSRSNYKYMYWNMVQQLAHHTVNGCNLRAGDVMASGTISGPEEGSFGSMLEISWQGTKPVKMPDGTERRFINDGDTVVMNGMCEKNGVKIGFGELRTKVLPAI
jgi:fumarylacetoacetase